ncbi:MAG: succinylglutamate desuccinylase/aspartoacylase family protein [Thermoflexales bacterium]|nr:succinylglutamate desuccinylase/aspartoacylase family protein [Thermoflexales bacterium]
MAGTKERAWLDVAPRAGGGLWRLPLLRVSGAAPGPRLAVLGAVHGDEYDGPEVIHHVFEQVDAGALRGELLMVPVCNVAAYEAAQRLNPIDGANLARVFPGRPNGTLTERFAHAITEHVIRGSAALIDLHSAGLAYNLPTLGGYTHSDSALHRANRALAEAFDAPILWAHPAPIPPGRSLSAADALGVPSMYTEAAGGGRVSAETLARFTQGVFNVLRHLGMLAGAPQRAGQPLRLIGDGNLDRVIDAPCAGHFRAEVRLLDHVRAGQRLGAIYDLTGALLTPVHADAPGVVILLRAMHRVHAGDGLVHLTQVQAQGEANTP